MRDLGSPMWAHHENFGDREDFPDWASNSTTLLISPDLGDYSVVSSTTDGESNTSQVPTVVAMPVDGTGPVVVAVHAVAPRQSAMGDWQSDLEWLADQCGSANVIMAGDFNATVDHMARLGTGGDLGNCRDAAVATGTAPWARGRPSGRRSSARRSTTSSRRMPGPRPDPSSSPRSTTAAATIARSSCSWNPPRTDSVTHRHARETDARDAHASGVRDWTHEHERERHDRTGDVDGGRDHGRPWPASAAQNQNRKQPFPQGFLDEISNGWAERPDQMPPERAQARFAARRRDAVSAAFPGRRLVLPAGSYKQRSNDTDYPFRPHSAFAHLTGGLPMPSPTRCSCSNRPVRRATTSPLLARARRPHDDRVLRRRHDRRVLDRAAAIARGCRRRARHRTAHIDAFEARDGDLVLDEDDDLTRSSPSSASSRTSTRSRRCDSRSRSRRAASTTSSRTSPHHRHAARRARGGGHLPPPARVEGNGEGYDTIAASGPHACYLHWTRNDGAVVPGDLILIDAGVEVDSLYTADITRTLPVSGTFTEVQRRVYETVRERPTRRSRSRSRA
jgi:hypothetical protein